jgi:hypothetical protein
VDMTTGRVRSRIRALEASLPRTCQLCIVTHSISSYVFVGENGQPIDPNLVSRAFRNAVAAAKLRHIPLHGLRHTHASHLIEVGVAISVVSNRLGHTDPNITLGVYTHQLRDFQAKAACTVADLVRKVVSYAMLANAGRGHMRGHRGRRVLQAMCREVVVARVRIELTTPRFSVVCSTN